MLTYCKNQYRSNDYLWVRSKRRGSRRTLEISLSEHISICRKTEGQFRLTFDNSVAYISNLHIRENLRGQGLGSIMMRELIKEAKRQNIITLLLDVLEDNECAIHLYKKFGFRRGKLCESIFGNSFSMKLYI